ncbi:restriction endonuclease [Streptomyces sp. NRRL S-1022]|uniref:restriction endonuclease n=1 Tax=Streptomyces sp. NRRL S-1022 TaxID=1463880 RepID=UPI000D14175C|nr:restriction endonuclease [Streptomyces sp. NRRL S-1022]
MSTPTHRTRPVPQGVIGCIGLPAVVFLGVAALLMYADGNEASAVLMLLLIVGGAVTVGRAQLRTQAEQRHIRAVQSTEIARYHAMNSREFEQAIAFLCERDGCRGVQVVGGAGDLGADVIATAPDGRRIVIQCKRYGPTTKVGSPDLQRFGGTCYSVHRAQVAAVVTTSVFTKPAVGYGTQHGIRLVDSGALAGWATRTGPAPWM